MIKANPAITLPLLILAGVFGTRLQSVLSGSPKAHAPVHWIKQGITSFVFLLHHHADLIIKFLKSEENTLLKDCKVQYVTEPKPMKTGGAVAYAINQLDLEGDFLLTNADTWIGRGVEGMIKAPWPAILVVKVEDVGRYGEVIFDDDRLVTAFVEKRKNSNIGWINAGISRLNVSFFKGWDGRPFSLEAITYPQLVKQKVLAAMPLDTDFIDIGIPEDYVRFCRWVESGKTSRL